MNSDVLFNRCHKISKAGAIFSIVLSLIVIAGWIFNVIPIKSILPDWASMQLTTAIGFLLLGLCLLLIQAQDQTPKFISLGIMLITLFIMIFSGLTLLEHVFHLDLGIDQSVFKETRSKIASNSGGMSFITALNFLLSSLAILYSNVIKNRTLWPTHILALMIFLISLVALFGFAYGLESFYDEINYTQLSLHSSIAFIVISVSILFLDPRSGFTKIFILESIGSKLAWKLLPSIIMLPPLIGFLALGGEKLDLYDGDFQIIIVVMSFFIIFTILVWKAAYSIHVYEKQYRATNKRLRRIHLKNQVLIDAKKHLEEVSSRDALTGLSNRPHFRSLLEHAMLCAKRYKKLLGLFFIDLDNFKQINDRFGHEVGDKLLISFANRLKILLQEIDSIARLGGDEFTVIIEEPAEVENINVVAKRILDSLVEPFVIDGHILNVTVSIGVSSFPKDGNDIDTLIKNADIAMYQAKRSGKNKYQFYQVEYSL